MQGRFQAWLIRRAGAFSVWRPDGTLLEAEALVALSGPTTAEQNEALGLDIGPDSVAAQWDWGPISYPDAVEGLLRLEDRFRRDVESRQPVEAAARSSWRYRSRRCWRARSGRRARSAGAGRRAGPRASRGA